MTLIPIAWPKTIKLDDVVDALDTLAEQVAANTARLDTVVAHLQHDLEQHKAAANQRQQEIDTLKAEVKRQAWTQRTGRKA